jgi:hypothetical protein
VGVHNTTGLKLQSGERQVKDGLICDLVLLIQDKISSKLMRNIQA